MHLGNAAEHVFHGKAFLAEQHLPLLVGPDGRRLAKRHGDTRIAAYRAAGLAPGRILTALARASHWIAPDATVASLRDILPTFDLLATPRAPLVWSDERL